MFQKFTDLQVQIAPPVLCSICKFRIPSTTSWSHLEFVFLPYWGNHHHFNHLNLKSTPLASWGFKTYSKYGTGRVFFSPPMQWSNILPTRSKVGLENNISIHYLHQILQWKGLGLPSKLVNFEVHRCFHHLTFWPSLHLKIVKIFHQGFAPFDGQRWVQNSQF